MGESPAPDTGTSQQGAELDTGRATGPAIDRSVPVATASELQQMSQLVGSMPGSVPGLFVHRVETTPHREAYQTPDGRGGWRSVTWADAATVVRETAAGLVAIGVQPQDPVAIASTTRLEWIYADLGVMCAGAATTTIYPTTSAADVSFILSDSGSRVVIAEDGAQLAKVVACWPSLPDLLAVVVLDPDVVGPHSPYAGDQRIISMVELRSRGRDLLARDPDVITARVAAVEPDHLATLMYTSGTTGRPKGVRLPHSCWVYEATATAATGILVPDDLQYLWLPLSHSFGKLLLVLQFPVGFSTAVDGDLDRLVDNLAQVRPTVMAGAPRIYEKIHARVRTQLDAGSPARARIASWAFSVGHRVAARRRAGQPVPGVLAVQHALAQRLVFAKIQDRFGGRVRYFISGSAALSKDVAEWFHAAGIVILEGYGLTETSAGTFINRPDHLLLGTVGQPLPGTEVLLAADGEVLVRGPGVMQGYHNLPDETAAVLTEDGWFSTGDIGEFTDGCLRITDRKKDLIKTSGGKYVAPQLIETLFKAVCPYASQIVVHGDRRNYITALVTLDAVALSGWAENNGLTDLPYERIVASVQVRDLVAGYIDELNSRLNRWETIKRFTVLSADLAVEDGSLTPSLKLKRRTVEQRYADVLDAMYED